MSAITTIWETLKQPHVEWDELEEMLAGFPGWLTLVQRIRYPDRPMDSRIFSGPVRSDFTLIRQVDRERLRDFFAPFAILARVDVTPAARIAAFTAEGIDAARFCREHSRDAVPEIAESCEQVLEAIKADRTLLRPDRRSSADLLVPAEAAHSMVDYLLSSADTGPCEEAAPREAEQQGEAGRPATQANRRDRGEEPS